jgi:hypothetical protein
VCDTCRVCVIGDTQEVEALVCVSISPGKKNELSVGGLGLLAM